MYAIRNCFANIGRQTENVDRQGLLFMREVRKNKPAVWYQGSIPLWISSAICGFPARDPLDSVDKVPAVPDREPDGQNTKFQQ